MYIAFSNRQTRGSIAILNMQLIVGPLTSRPVFIRQGSGRCGGSSAIGVATLAYDLYGILQSLTVRAAECFFFGRNTTTCRVRAFRGFRHRFSFAVLGFSYVKNGIRELGCLIATRWGLWVSSSSQKRRSVRSEFVRRKSAEMLSCKPFEDYTWRS